MSHVFPRNSKSPPPVVESGDGAYLYDAKGKAFLNCGDAAVSCLGHSDAHVQAAIEKQLGRVAFAHTGFFTSEPAEQLASKLIANTPTAHGQEGREGHDALDKVYFVSGGSEAIEAGLKLARQYFIETGQPERHKVIARRQSYHGNTLGALATGGNEWRRQPFSPLLIDVGHVSPCFAYRDQKDQESDEAYVERLIDELESKILEMDPTKVMAFVAEPVVGATLGAVPPVADYFQKVRQLCDRYGILLILDEVMCGMGRTGTLFAYEQHKISPDICTIAKGLGGGYQPIGAMMCTGKIHQAIKEGSGFFQHGHTYLGHPIACAAAHAVLERLLDQCVINDVQSKGAKLQETLEATFGDHPFVGDLRGVGLFRGMELVQDRSTKQPFDPSDRINQKVKKAAFEAGLICYPMGGTIDGKHGDHVLLAPPFIITDDQIVELVDKLNIALKSVFTSI